MGEYIKLSNLQVYQLSRKLSCYSWEIYRQMDWQMKKVIGDQFVRAVDSIGANIAEGYGRYHYLDKIKFYYNARASHYEAIIHWLSLLYERKIIAKELYQNILHISNELAPKLNSFINTTYRAKDNFPISNFQFRER